MGFKQRWMWRVWDYQDKRMISPVEEYQILVIGEDYIELCEEGEERQFYWGTDGYDFMQCTGVRDSDGNLVWEGDVVKCTYESGRVADSRVVWHDEHGTYVVEDETGKLPLHEIVQRRLNFVVVGNKYEIKD